MLGDIVTRLLRAHPDIEIVASVEAMAQLTSAADVMQPDVMLVGLSQMGFATEWSTWLEQHPAVKVFAVGADGRYLSELHSDDGGASFESLISAIRGVGDSRPAEHPRLPESE